jgi:hypothetical protein
MIEDYIGSDLIDAVDKNSNNIFGEHLTGNSSVNNCFLLI